MDYRIIDGCMVYYLKDIEAGAKLVAKDIPLEMYESDEFEDIAGDFYAHELYEQNEDHQLWMTTGYIHIPELHAKVHEVDYCRRLDPDEMEDPEGEPEYEGDFSGWIFYHDETDEHLYEEGYSSFTAAVWNGFHRNIEDLKCDVYAKEISDED